MAALRRSGRAQRSRRAPARSRGQPTKYRPEYPARLLAFIRRGGPRILKPLIVSEGQNQGSTIVDHVIGKLPGRFEGFARTLDVHMDTLEEWKRVHPKFSVAWKKAKAIQLEQLLHGLLSGTYQVAGTIFDLKNNHGYKDRLDLNGSGGQGSQTHYHYTTINVDAKPEEVVGDILAELSRRPALPAA